MWFRATSRRSSEPALFDEPFLRRLERLSLQTRRSLRGNPMVGDHPSRYLLPSGIFSDHRPYSAGDDLRYVDWNGYARQEVMHVKLGDVEQDVQVHLLLDVSRSMAHGQPAKLRVAQRLLGALGYLALTGGDRVRYSAFGDALDAQLGPLRGRGQVRALLAHIAAAKLRTRTALERVLVGYARAHPRGGLLVLASDLLAPEGLAEGLRHLPAPRWQVLVLHLLASDELQPALRGPLELEDVETGQRLELTLDADLLAEYRRGVTRWQEQLRLSCAGAGALYAPVLTAWPVERQVVPYLRQRGAIR